MFCSIIIPYKNSSKTIQNCIESTLKQNFDNKNYEVILISDFSDKKTDYIVKKFIKKNSNYKLIYSKKKTIGPGHARNLGIHSAKGNYLYFLDSDDYLKKNTLKILYMLTLKKRPDLICNNFKVIDKSKNFKTKKRYDLNLLRKKNSFIKNYFNLSIIGQVISNLFKKNIIIKNKILFKEGFFEDILFFFKAFYFSKNKIFLDKILYVKIYTKKSIVNSITSDHLKYGMKAYYQIYQFLLTKKNNIKINTLKTLCMIALVGQFAVLLKRIKTYNISNIEKTSLESRIRLIFHYYKKKINIVYQYKTKKDVFVSKFLSRF
jgi:poly(ribitol-phosphate) beta-N-acetylglucosaminyltransferase|tara:strand:+ start:574 stop:1530 length:957 start_codon:yes stop_codon:yes gene_type:complete